MNRTNQFSLSILCFFICFLLAMSGIRARDEALAADIAPKILRFHVLANSDSAEDQALKLCVKDLLLEKIRDDAAADQIAGKEDLNLPLALDKLYRFFRIQKLLLEGGSVINGVFARENMIDELSLVLVPTVAGKDGKPLFYDSILQDYILTQTKLLPDSSVWLNYHKK